MAEGGRMVLPVGGMFFQDFMAYDKINGEIVKTSLTPVRYVPLTDLNKQVLWFYCITIDKFIKNFFINLR